MQRPSPPNLAWAGVDPVPAVSTIWLILSRRGFITLRPQKRPRSSWQTFCAGQLNERWQADITHWQLAGGAEVEILNIIDDHSGLAIACHARAAVSDPKRAHRLNGAVFTAKQRGQGRVAVEVELGLRGPG